MHTLATDQCLDSLFNHPDVDIRDMAQIQPHLAARMARALDPTTLISELRVLANEDDFFVRMKAAENPSMPGDVLVELADDGFDQVRAAAARNASLPENGFTLLRKRGFSQTPGIEKFVAAHPNCPVEILESLASKEQVWFPGIASGRLREMEYHAEDPECRGICDGPRAWERLHRKEFEDWCRDTMVGLDPWDTAAVQEHLAVMGTPSGWLSHEEEVLLEGAFWNWAGDFLASGALTEDARTRLQVVKALDVLRKQEQRRIVLDAHARLTEIDVELWHLEIETDDLYVEIAEGDDLGIRDDDRIPGILLDCLKNHGVTAPAPDHVHVYPAYI